MNLATLLLATGLWRAVLTLSGGAELPFQMEINKNNNHYTFTIINGDERLVLDEYIERNDSLIVRFPVYEAELQLYVNNEKELTGNFINLTRAENSHIPLKAYAGNQPRFYPESRDATLNVAGRWSVMFSPGTADSSYAIGVFHQDGTRVTGTFLTTSGDYRYLEGVMNGDSLYLSTFNGVFVYLFKAKVKKQTIEGTYWSGPVYSTKFTGFRDENAMLPDANSITSYKDTVSRFAFSFPDTDSNVVKLTDPQFENKVVVVQFMGSWCPNCLDESVFLESFYRQYKEKGVEIVGLSFEKTDDFNRAAGNINRFRNRLGITYTVLYASNRSKLKTVFPELENFHSYPTTMFLDKQHKIRKIHAGFSGAATGDEYLKFQEEFLQTIEKLLNE